MLRAYVALRSCALINVRSWFSVFQPGVNADYGRQSLAWLLLLSSQLSGVFGLQESELLLKTEGIGDI